MECFICNQETRLVEAIGEEEIIQICENCAEKNNFPIIQKPNIEQIKDTNRFVGIKERLSKQAGVDLKKHENKEINKELQEIVSKNLRVEEYNNLIDNFHWHIQHARRMKKISQKQLAESIAEPEIIVVMAEKGNLPENYEKIVGKLEQYLGLKLFKEDKKIKEDFDIKKINLENVTVKELKEIHEGKQGEEKDVEKKFILDSVAEKIGEKKEKKGFWEKVKDSFSEEDEEMKDLV